MQTAKQYGAKGDGIADDTIPVRKACLSGKPVDFGKGTYLIKGFGVSNGVIPITAPIYGDEATIVLTARSKPTPLFYQPWWKLFQLDNFEASGISFKSEYKDSFANSHALWISNGNGIKVNHCTFEGFRGDGILIGDAQQWLYTPGLRLRITRDVEILDNTFKDIFREGIMMCCTDGGLAERNTFTGNGYQVAAIDIERHHIAEQVNNITVRNNKFDFSKGLSPSGIHYRRAVSMGYFYDGYANDIADGKAAGHLIANNKIIQGQIDCWGHTYTTIENNTFSGPVENVTGKPYISQPNIHCIGKSGYPSRPAKGMNGLVVRGNNGTCVVDGYNILE